jgi:hypothetical protein
MRSAMILTSVLLLGACNMTGHAEQGEGGGGEKANRSYQVGSFDRVSLAGSHNVVVAVGGAPSVRAEGPAKTLDRLDIRVENGALEIGSKKGDWSFKHDRGQVTVYVTVPSLGGAAIGGSGDMKIDRVQGERFAASIAGSGDMDVGAVQVAEMGMEIAGSGGITAKGSAGHSKISIAGSGDVEASGLESKTANVSMVGSGDVRVRATEMAEISIMGSGDVTVSGPAKCRISKMGSGEARCES